MADTVVLPGTGAVVATDEVTDGTLGTVQVQYVKLMDGALNGTAKGGVDANGRLAVLARPSGSGTATTSRPSASTTASAQLLAANTSRIGATIWNEGAQELYVKCGTTASTTDYTVRLAPGSYWETPFNYTGRIDAITSTSTAQSQVTEYT
jgi:hypothetical protein